MTGRDSSAPQVLASPLAERCPNIPKVEVAGSNPVPRSTIFEIKTRTLVRVFPMRCFTQLHLSLHLEPKIQCSIAADEMAQDAVKGLCSIALGALHRRVVVVGHDDVLVARHLHGDAVADASLVEQCGERTAQSVKAVDIQASSLAHAEKVLADGVDLDRRAHRGGEDVAAGHTRLIVSAAPLRSLCQSLCQLVLPAPLQDLDQQAAEVDAAFFLDLSSSRSNREPSRSSSFCVRL